MTSQKILAQYAGLFLRASTEERIIILQVLIRFQILGHNPYVLSHLTFVIPLPPIPQMGSLRVDW